MDPCSLQPQKSARLNPLDGVFQRVPRISPGALPPAEQRPGEAGRRDREKRSRGSSPPQRIDASEEPAALIIRARARVC